jgi:VCBS repeat-containing protein
MCNKPPAPVDDGPTETSEDTLLTVAAPGVLANDTDAESDPLTAELITSPTHGTLNLAADGGYTYTPDADYHGDDSFTYRAHDATSASSNTATVTLQVASVDDLGPQADPTLSSEPNAAGWHDRDVTVKWNWTDDDAGIDSANCTTQTTSDGQGSLTLTATCADRAGNETIAQRTVKVDTSAPTIRIDSPFHAFLYFPGDPGLIADYACRDELSGIESCTGSVADGAPLDPATGFQMLRVTARDRVGHEEFAWVEVLVDTPPDAADGSFTGPRDTDLRGTLAGLASDADHDELEFEHATGPSHGTVSVNADGTFRYRPDPGFVGVDTFRYRVLDRWIAERAEVTITITDIEDRGDPGVTITSPAAGRYLQGAVVTADYACTDSDSGIAACTGSVADGARIDTSRPGVHSFAVTARDRAGNDYTAAVAYTVVVRPTCNGRPATIVGTAGVDVLTGTSGPDVIVAGSGRDWITAGSGDDTICSGAARDIIRGGDGNDTVNAGPDRDVVLGGVGNDTLSGSMGGDILVGGTGDDRVHGAAGYDTLLGAGGDDHLSGGGNTDSCRGGTGTDRASSCERILGIP